MYEKSRYDRMLLIERLEKKTSEWFKKNNALPEDDLFLRYFYESRRGGFSVMYSELFDDSIECMHSTLPLLADKLSRSVSDILNISRWKIRQVMSILVYWLIQFYSGGKRDIPGVTDVRDIIVSIIKNDTIEFP